MLAFSSLLSTSMSFFWFLLLSSSTALLLVVVVVLAVLEVGVLNCHGAHKKWHTYTNTSKHSTPETHTDKRTLCCHGSAHLLLLTMECMNVCLSCLCVNLCPHIYEKLPQKFLHSPAFQLLANVWLALALEGQCSVEAKATASILWGIHCSIFQCISQWEIL